MKKEFFLAVGTMILSACASEDIGEKARVETTMTAENNQEIEADPLTETTENTKLSTEKQDELQKSIAEMTGLTEESVLLMIAPISDQKNNEFSCSVVLSTESVIDDVTYKKVVDSIITTISTMENATISENGITITNKKGQVLP